MSDITADDYVKARRAVTRPVFQAIRHGHIVPTEFSVDVAYVDEDGALVVETHVKASEMPAFIRWVQRTWPT